MAPCEGLWLALRRLSRCHPITWLGGSSGFDPVPLSQDTITHEQQQRINNNMLLALALAALVLFGWQYFVATPQMKAEQAHQAALAHQEKTHPLTPGRPRQCAGHGAGIHAYEPRCRAEGRRRACGDRHADGWMARSRSRARSFDDLRLKKYHETTDPKSPEIVLLAPKSTDFPYYAEFGWVGASRHARRPEPVDSKAQGGTLSPGHPVTLTWDNGHGLIFTRIIAIDDQYMFTVADSVANNSGAGAQTLYPFAYVAREGVPKEQTSLDAACGLCRRRQWQRGRRQLQRLQGPRHAAQDLLLHRRLGRHHRQILDGGGHPAPERELSTAPIWAPPRRATSTPIRPITGCPRAQHRARRHAPASPTACSPAPRWWTSCAAMRTIAGIARFDNAVDWGWFWFLTQPFFWLLDIFYKFIGNFGLAILMLTVVVKLLFFPLANASFKSMSKMKKVQPQMEALKKAHDDDPQKQQMAMMELYKREKVNPLAGCVPMLIHHSGVLLALQGALRHHRDAPGAFLWLDPRSVGARSHLDPQPVRPSALSIRTPCCRTSWLILSIGVWPILMGITQFVQTKLNPAAARSGAGASMFTFMPLIFTFMFATFPAGW